MKKCPDSSLVVALAAVTMLSAGCSPGTFTLVDDVGYVPTTKLQFVDARAPDEKAVHTTMLSTSPGSCDYFIWQLGENLFSPPRLVLLQKDLEKTLGSKLNDKTITVVRYGIYLNQQRQQLERTASKGALYALATMLSVPNDCTRV